MIKKIISAGLFIIFLVGATNTAYARPSEELMSKSSSCYIGASAFAMVFAVSAEEQFYFHTLAKVGEPIIKILPQYAEISDQEFNLALEVSLKTMIDGLTSAKENGQVSPDSVAKMRNQVEATCNSVATLRISEGL